MIVASLCASASADVFNMPSGQTSLSLVPVGNPGNPHDPFTGGNFGGVGYSYNIGKFEVTIGQYAEFLNAVAASDTYGLYHVGMANVPNIAGIARSSSAGGYSYSPIGSPNKPISVVSWGSAARFSNWLTNGQPTGPQSLTTTEDGSYFLNGATSQAALMAITRKPNARFVIPSEDEWYKAAYFDPTPGAGGGENYWLYPMRNDLVPYSDQPPGSDAPNAALAGNFFRDDGLSNNYNDGYAVSAVPVWSANQHYLTDVGAYPLASSYYGTFDQGGNVDEWNEAAVTQLYRCIRGAAWGNGEMWSLTRQDQTPTAGTSFNGFRIAEVPEPGSLAMLVFGCMILPKKRRSISR